MAAFSLNSIILCATSVFAFISFSWAVKSHFIDPEERTVGMRFILVANPACLLVTMATYFHVEVDIPGLLTGLVLYGASLALFWSAIISTRAAHRLTFAFSKDTPTFLLQSGPYRFVRHPFYTSYLLFWLAGAVATRTWWLAALMFVMALLYWAAARTEERKFISSTLADSYRAYAAKTGMFLPWISAR